MLKLRDYRNLIEHIEPGGTERTNHDGCEAGTDTRQRLYITRPLADPTVVLGYCHNCAQGSKWTTKEYRAYRGRQHAERIPRMPTIYENVYPLSTMRKLDEWPACGRAWAIKNGIDQARINLYQIGFDTSSNRVYLPMYQQIASPSFQPVGFDGYQLRCVEGTGPKYLTVRKKDSEGYSMLTSTGTARIGETCIIVEDLVSGIHLATAGWRNHLTVFVNYGVKINPHVVQRASQFERAGVWLDNDSDQIVEMARKYGRTIQLYGPRCNVQVNSLSTDPKKYTPKKLNEELSALWTA